MSDTEKLIHELFKLWDQDNDGMELTDEDVFTAGANAIINHLILHDRLK